MEQVDNAISQLRETPELAPKNYLTPLLLALALVAKGNYAEALDIFQASPNARENPELLSMIGYAQALGGGENEARQILKELEDRAQTEEIEANNLAYIYTALGDTERAFEYLEKAFHQRCPDLLSLKVDPRLKPLRGDARFDDLIRRIYSSGS